MTEVEAYIRASALARGIDPDVAVRVAQSEGGLNDPFRHGEGPAPKSQAAQYGDKENAIGPFQLYLSGTGAGMGDQALASGVDPRKDWKAGVDFALNQVVQKGWGQWYGAKKQGITGMTGVGDNARTQGLTLTSNPVSTTGTSPVTSTYSRGAVGPDGVTPVEGTPVADAAPKTWVDKLKSLIGGEEKTDAEGNVTTEASGLESLTKAFAKPKQTVNQDANIQLPSALAGMGGDDAMRMQSAQALMAQLLSKNKKVPGMSLMG